MMKEKTQLSFWFWLFHLDFIHEKQKPFGLLSQTWPQREASWGLHGQAGAQEGGQQ